MNIPAFPAFVNGLETMSLPFSAPPQKKLLNDCQLFVCIRLVSSVTFCPFTMFKSTAWNKIYAEPFVPLVPKLPVSKDVEIKRV